MSNMEMYQNSVPPSLPLCPPPPDWESEQGTLTVYGLGLTPRQFQKTRRRPTRWLPAVAMSLCGIIGLAAVGLAATYGSATESTAIAYAATIALLLWMVGMLRHNRFEQAVETAAWQVYAAETNGGLITTVYGDMIEQRSARWSEKVPLSDASYTEWEDLMLIENGVQLACLRAEDLTPAEAQAVYERICENIPPERRYAHGRFVAGRTESAPPPFSTEPPRCYDRFTVTRPAEKTAYSLPNGTVCWFAAAGLIFGALFSAIFSVTGEFLLDFILFMCAFLVPVMTLGVWTMRRPCEPAAQLTLSFTADGLHVSDGVRERFVAASDVHATRTSDGALLFTPAGKIAFSWTSSANRQQLEWMLFGHSY